ncbi:MAG: hypothetical protein KU37_03670 [Sulfuricurvum sp. PC08-66]|nr:MAG: hypothetical protein KU37_03670 [Sulfuricurvum sp. PC08-66]
MKIDSAISFTQDNKAVLLEKRIRLLELIEQYGSLSKAAKEVPLSYKAAWDAIDAMNNLAGEPLVIGTTGGSGGGGSMLSAYGKEVLHTYRVVAAKHQQFLASLNETLGASPNLDKNLATIQRISMKLSARNQLACSVTDIKVGAVNSEIVLQTRSGTRLVSIITNDSVERLSLKKGSDVIAIFKANAVLIAKDSTMKISARNQLSGKIVALTQGSVNAELTVSVGDDSVTASITLDALNELSLATGDSVTAIIKASSIILGV